MEKVKKKNDIGFCSDINFTLLDVQLSYFSIQHVALINLQCHHLQRYAWFHGYGAPVLDTHGIRIHYLTVWSSGVFDIRHSLSALQEKIHID